MEVLTTAMQDLNNKNDHDLLVTMAAIMNRWDAQLFGNGQPGILDVLERRTRNLERWRWTIGGGMLVLMALASIAIRYWTR